MCENRPANDCIAKTYGVKPIWSIIVKVEIKDKEELTKELNIEIPAETVNSRIDLKLKEVQKTTELKGFRKGKAPMDMIKKLYGEKVKFEAAEDILKDTYPQAVQEHKIRVASYPNVTAMDFTDEGGLTYTATVEVFPEIDKVEIEGLELTEETIEVKDEEVDQVVEMMQKNFSEVREVERPVGATDIVVLDIDKLEDKGNVIPTDKFEDSEVDLSNKMTIKEFSEALPGMKKGETKEITVNYADDYPDKQFAGAELKYKCTVKQVKERLLDELNDGFAKKTGQGETMLELRMNIRENVKNQKEEEKNRAKKTQIIEHIVSKNEIPIPNSLVENYLENVVKDFKEQYKDQKVDEEEIKKNYEPIGRSNIRWNMLMHKIAENEKITVQTEDVDALIQKFADNYKITKDQAKEHLRQSGNIADLRESLLEEKVIDFISGKAKIISADKK